MSPAAAYLALQQFGLGLEIQSIWQATLFFLIAPLVEEWALRAGLQEWLAEHFKRPHLANLLVALVFAGLHWQNQLNVALLWLIPSLALGELWRQRKSLSQCVAMHAWFNATLWWMSS